MAGIYIGGGHRDARADDVPDRTGAAPCRCAVRGALTSEIDRAVIAEGGVIGRHAGDGVTAFFLGEQVGSEEAAAAAAVRASRRIAEVVDRIDARSEAGVAIKIGLHWGQPSSSGRSLPRAGSR